MTTTYELYTNENGTPKAVEGKAPAILERVEALEETLDNGVVTSVNGNTGDITPEQTGCLPLSGGTIDGVLSTYSHITKATDSNWLDIVGGTEYGKGAYLSLSGKNSERGGRFDLTANDGANSKILMGYADGTLTWGGSDVITSNGGTMSGVLVRKGTFVNNSVDTANLQINGGSGWNNGASIDLYGKSRTNDNGAFKFRAHDGTNYKDFIGKPDGTLTWGGKSLLTTEKGWTISKGINGWARDNATGFTIVWGRGTLVTTGKTGDWAFPKRFKQTVTYAKTLSAIYGGQVTPLVTSTESELIAVSGSYVSSGTSSASIALHIECECNVQVYPFYLFYGIS